MKLQLEWLYPPTGNKMLYFENIYILVKTDSVVYIVYLSLMGWE